MNPNLRTNDVVKSSLLITLVVTAMLLPVIIIAWICKWIYKSRK